MSAQYVYRLDDSAVFQIMHNLESFKGLGLNGDAVNVGTFPLPAQKELLDEICNDLHNGSGVAILRGFAGDGLSNEDMMTAFLGISSHIGPQRGMQDRRGSMLTHVTDSKNWKKVRPELRHGIHTNTMLGWHNDMGVDILALHVRSLAEKGGNTYIASAETVYKELAASHPEVVKTLCQANWPVQTSGNPPRHILAPLLHVAAGRVFSGVDPGRLGLHPATAAVGRKSSIPPLSTEQLEALAVFSDAATKHRVRLDMRTGDIVFLNNWAHLHCRDGYTDSDNGGPRRHLVRLWLRDPARAWPVPESMRIPWEAAFGPGGTGHPTILPGRWGDLRGAVERKYPVVPAPEYRPPKYTAGSAAFVLEDEDDINGGGLGGH